MIDIEFLTKDYLISEYIEKERPIAKIAADFGIHKKKIYKALANFNLSLKSKKEDILTKELLEKEYSINKRTAEDIAIEFSCEKKSVLRRLRKYNIPVRDNRNSHTKIEISKDYLLEHYINQKKSTVKIASELGCGRIAVENALVNYDINQRTNLKYKFNKKHLINYYILDKLSTNEIAEIYDVSPATILRHLKKLNIEIRDESECHKKYDIDKEYLKIEYIENKRTLNDIAREIGCTSGTIGNNLESFNISKDERYIGKILGKYKLIEKISNDKWLGTCTECGIELVRSLDSFRRLTSCECSRNPINNKSPYWKGYGEISGGVWTGVKSSAVLREKDFNITIEEAWNLFLEQDRKCRYTKLDLYFGEKRVDKRVASLDRTNSLEGYSKANCSWVHPDINNMKWHFDEETFIYFCFLIINYKNTSFEKLEISEVVGHPTSKGYKLVSANKMNRLHTDRGNGRKLEIDIDAQYIWELFISQNGRCALTGIPISFDPTGKGRKEIETVSIDRKDCEKGYVKNNIRLVHKKANAMRMNFSDEYLIELCTLVCKNCKVNDLQLLQPNQHWHEQFIENKLWARQRSKRSNQSYKGVTYQEERGLWKSRLFIKNKYWHFGYFDDEMTAAHNYDYHSINLFGKTVLLNFPDFDYSNFIPKKSTEELIKTYGNPDT